LREIERLEVSTRTTDSDEKSKEGELVYPPTDDVVLEDEDIYGTQYTQFSQDTQSQAGQSQSGQTPPGQSPGTQTPQDTYDATPVADAPVADDYNAV
jgi:hypothetical protein